MAISTFNKGMRPSKRATENEADQKVINRAVTTRRLKRIKPSMPEFKCLEDDDEDASNGR